MNRNIELKEIPTNTKNFMINGNKDLNNWTIRAQSFRNQTTFLHHELSYDEAVKTVTQYFIKHQGINFER